MELTQELLSSLAYGGVILGCGGGGHLEEGLRNAELALQVGRPRLIDLDALAPHDTLITVSGVGAPAAKNQDVRPCDYLKALNTLLAQTGQAHGLISSENGGSSSLNGFIQSALSGLPVVDAPCNGRAHPTGVMGSMGLNFIDGYISKQAAAGGAHDCHVEIYVQGALTSVDHIIRQASIAAGGVVAVARNPVTVQYARDHAAPGALRLAIELGQLAQSLQDGRQLGERLAERLQGEVLEIGTVDYVELATRDGYDIGTVRIGGIELTFWNEYMTAERGGIRLATFPDAIITLDVHTGAAVNTADISQGREIIVIKALAINLPLGAGVKDARNLRAAERAIQKILVTEESDKIC